MTSNQIALMQAKETQRADRVKERETQRANMAKEAETRRSNLAHEKETHRANIHKEAGEYGLYGPGVTAETRRELDEEDAFSQLKGGGGGDADKFRTGWRDVAQFVKSILPFSIKLRN